MQFSASYNSANQPVGTSYSFDSNGNSLIGPYDAVHKQYVQYPYDGENRILGLSEPGGLGSGTGTIRRTTASRR